MASSAPTRIPAGPPGPRLEAANKERRLFLERALERVGRGPGIRGAVLVRRDGVCAAASGPRGLPVDVIGAMGAAAFAACEIVLRELDSDAVVRIQVETHQLHVIILGASAEMLLVAVSDPDVTWDHLYMQARAMVKEAIRWVE